jgi:hypothetical protein
MSVKAAHKTLMKLTPDLEVLDEADEEDVQLNPCQTLACNHSTIMN